MNKIVATPTNFVKRHKAKFLIAGLVVTTTGTVLMFKNQKDFNAFLKEHNLFDTYYPPTIEA